MNVIKEKILDLDYVDVNIFTSKVNSQLLIQDAATKYDIDYNVSEIKNTKRKRIDLFYKNKSIGNIRGLNISTTHRNALKLCRDKFVLEKFLEKFDISVLNSYLFTQEQKQNAFDLLKKFENEKFVIKPTSLFGGKGIETNINIDNFSNAWDRSLIIQKENGVDEPKFIIQKYIEGFDIRVSIIEGQFSAAELRIPPHLIGDGESTIAELIKKKNAIRSEIYYFKSKLIPINKSILEKLKKDNKNLDFILKKNEVYVINEMSNMVVGAESVDITDNLSKNIIDESIKAVAAIPGLHSASIDFMCEDYTSGDGYIIEVNTNGNHTQHHVPYKGSPQYPFELLMKSLIVKHKLRNGMKLTIEETKISKNIFRFLEMKDFYTSKMI